MVDYPTIAGVLIISLTLLLPVCTVALWHTRTHLAYRNDHASGLAALYLAQKLGYLFNGAQPVIVCGYGGVRQM